VQFPRFASESHISKTSILTNKKNCHDLGIDPTMNMSLSWFGNRSHDEHVGPAPYGGGLQFLPVLLDWVANMIR